MRRGGFTLIELMAVVVLLGLTAGAVAWSMTGTLARRTAEDAAAQIAGVDRQARVTAERQARDLVLRIDLNRQRLRWFDPDSGDGGHPRPVPRAYRIDRVWVMDDAGRVRINDRNQVDITITGRGRSATYAIRMAVTTDQPDAQASDGWMVFAGLTGQVTWIGNEDELQNLFAVLEGARPDAD